MKRFLFPSFFLSLLFVPVTKAGDPAKTWDNDALIENLVVQASTADEIVSLPAIEALRLHGQEGLEAFLTYHKDDFQNLKGEEAKALHYKLDQISQQKDSYYSGLFWYTDLNKAMAVSKEQKKPILSLRMLGKLTDDLSCANSRFFRTLLYSNTSVSKFMRENYILHWSSERPVPIVTIDFGDGRVMKRTVTGNSIHYVLDNEGKVIEAIPSLYSPDQFLGMLTEAHALHNLVQFATPETKLAMLASYHYARIDEIKEQADESLVDLVGRANANLTIDASAVQRITKSKASIELPILAAIKPPVAKKIEPTKIDPWKALRAENDPDEARWIEIANEMQIVPKIDENSRALIRSKNPEKYADVVVFASEIKAIEDRLLIESARNQYMLHYNLHKWISQAEEPIEMQSFNEKVYAELFLTPVSDPWLGMKTDNAYTAIENDGIAVTK